MHRSFRLGILATHPIQYHAPWFRYLAERLELDVFFVHQQDAAGQAAAGFAVPFEWDVPLLEGYRHHWLRNVARRPSVAGFAGCDTPDLGEQIASQPFDAFLLCGWNKMCFLQAHAACRRLGVPVMSRGDSQLQTKRSYVKTAAKYLPYRWFLRRFDAHLFVGQRNREYLRHYGVPDSRLFFSPHFVDNEFFAARAAQAAQNGSRLQIRTELGIPPEGFVFLFVGKLLARKRPADLIEAASRVFASPGGSAAYAVFVGDGPLRESLARRAAPGSDRIRFAGFRNQSQLPAYYLSADALVLPSEGSETWGLVVNEAMACGRPCIVSEAAGCGPDLIDDRYTGFGFPTGNTEALADRMLTLMRQARQNPAAVTRELAARMKRYSVSSATNGLLAALEAVTGRSSEDEQMPFCCEPQVRV